MRTARRTTVAPPLPSPEKISGVSMPSTPGGSGSRIGRIGLGFCGAVGFAAGGEEEFAGAAVPWRPQARRFDANVGVGRSELEPVEKGLARSRRHRGKGREHKARTCCGLCGLSPVGSLAVLHAKMNSARTVKTRFIFLKKSSSTSKLFHKTCLEIWFHLHKIHFTFLFIMLI
jgi:hypothetical protein